MNYNSKCNMDIHIINYRFTSKSNTLFHIMQYILFVLVIFASPATNKRRVVRVRIGYHKNFGIPYAANIKALERKTLSNKVEVNHPYSDDWIFRGEGIHTHPYMGGLVNDVTTGELSVCASSLLTQNRLVTAAHCWWDGRRQAGSFTVVLGSSWLFYGGTRIKTSHVVMHPKWNTVKLVNNIAIIYLPGNVWFSATIQPINLPSSEQDWDQPTNEWVTAVGFERFQHLKVISGSTNYSAINEVKLQVISLDRCRDFFGHRTHSTNICTSGAGGVMICNKNSGGPLIANRTGLDVLVGIASYVPHGCQFGYPSVFTKVSSYYNFIIRHLRF